MRRVLIRNLLPLALALVPPLAAVLIAVAVPAEGLRLYLGRIKTSPIDWLILGLGGLLFVAQVPLAWRALRVRGDGFDERPDRWLNSMAQAAEWFPLLGLIGTVAAIMQTFSSLDRSGPVQVNEVIRLYGPALTATGSGLYMALLNILPVWVVQFGRDLIASLGGTEAGGEP